MADDITDLNPFGQTRDRKISFSWKNLTVLAECKEGFTKKCWRYISGNSKARDEPLKILDSASGHAEGGHLIAIMGPSGAGKTTLMATLARRIDSSSGCIEINGRAISAEDMTKIAGYIPQFDALPLAITALEYAMFTCALRLDKATSCNQRQILIENIFTELGLHGCRDTLNSKLSGGEKKRLSLAAELVTKPKILFLDEPTSGLDTWTAMRVIESAESAAKKGTIVFCSIHQPAMDLYRMFSHLILLANGKTAFSGTLENATKFFNSEGFICPTAYNEAEFYVKVVSNERSTTLKNSAGGYSAQVCSAFSKSSYSKIPATSSTTESFEIKSEINKPSCISQFYWLIWRSFLECRRTMFDDWIHHQTYLISVMLIGMFYVGVNPRIQAGIQDSRGALYLAASQVIFTAAYSVIYELPREMPLYLRESTMYGPGVYYISTVFGLIPKALLKAFIFITVLFLTLDVNDDFVAYMQFCFYIMMGAISATAYGTMISGCIDDCDIATTVMVPIDLTSLLMAGMFYNIRTLPPYLTWLKYTSIFYYTSEALAIVHFSNIDTIECSDNHEFPCFATGSDVLTEYGYKESNLWLDLWGLVILTIFMNLVGYWGVRRRRMVK